MSKSLDQIGPNFQGVGSEIIIGPIKIKLPHGGILGGKGSI